jgi:hypothetical protein
MDTNTMIEYEDLEEEMTNLQAEKIIELLKIQKEYLSKIYEVLWEGKK